MTTATASTTASPSPHPDGAREAGDDTVAVQLRRRREAALRLPPLPSGCRDPWTGR